MTLHQRIAQDLKWPMEDVQSFSLATLGVLVKCVQLRQDIRTAINTGDYIIQ